MTALKKFDPAAAARIAPTDEPKLIRAIEVRMHVLSPAYTELTRPVEPEELQRSSCQFENVRVEINSLPTFPFADKHAVY